MDHLALPDSGGPSGAPGAQRILFVTDSFDIGGAERALLHLAGLLIGAGHTVEVAGSSGGSLLGDARSTGALVHVFGPSAVKRRQSRAFARDLERLLSERPFDVVHSHMHASTHAASIAATRVGTPLVVTEHSEARWRHGPARTAARAAFDHAALVIAVSEQIRHRLIAVDHLDPAKVRVIHNALPEAALAPVRAWREASGPVIGVVARLQPEKDIATFVDAAAILAREVPDARFVVVGDGPLRSDLEAKVARLGLSARFVLLGFRSDAAALIGAFDVLAVPSRTEGTPLTVLEAMAAGTPVVATRVGGIPEQVRHGEEALLVDPGNPVGLAGAIAGLLADPERAVRISARARMRLGDRFSPEAMVASVVDCYHTVLAAPARAGHRDRAPDSSSAAVRTVAPLPPTAGAV
jgi:glycosyltransferase involved in cell wall biosynthesis